MRNCGKAQQEMYRDRALQKRTCKTAEDLEFFEASEDDYRERLKQIKLQKKDNRKKLKAVERCLEREGSLAEAELGVSDTCWRYGGYGRG